MSDWMKQRMVSSRTGKNRQMLNVQTYWLEFDSRQMPTFFSCSSLFDLVLSKKRWCRFECQNVQKIGDNEENESAFAKNCPLRKRLEESCALPGSVQKSLLFRHARRLGVKFCWTTFAQLAQCACVKLSQRTTWPYWTPVMGKLAKIGQWEKLSLKGFHEKLATLFQFSCWKKSSVVSFF